MMVKHRAHGPIKNRDRRRTNVEIVVKILESANGQILPSKLIMKANLNTRRMQRYSDMLVKDGLLSKKTVSLNGQRRILFVTSEEGLEYLSVLKGIKEIGSALQTEGVEKTVGQSLGEKINSHKI